jgi:lipopolysaccharide/colanic/teichoic acid biosynthesis glycosyltransferase
VAPRAASDPRVTEYGKWLRATSIDELPQLLNVLRGEMSLVGPRPEMPFIVDGYDEWQRRRLAVKPGITGLWQILGRKDLPMHENLQYDFYYIRNRSLALDVSILLRTIGAVLSRRGAF